MASQYGKNPVVAGFPFFRTGCATHFYIMHRLCLNRARNGSVLNSTGDRLGNRNSLSDYLIQGFKTEIRMKSDFDGKGGILKKTRRQMLKVMGATATASLRPGFVIGVAQMFGGCGGGGSDVPVSDPSVSTSGTRLRIPPVLDPA